MSGESINLKISSKKKYTTSFPSLHCPHKSRSSTSTADRRSGALALTRPHLPDLHWALGLVTAVRNNQAWSSPCCPGELVIFLPEASLVAFPLWAGGDMGQLLKHRGTGKMLGCLKETASMWLAQKGHRSTGQPTGVRQLLRNPPWPWKSW